MIDSNTTLVKVKSCRSFHFYKTKFNSNTTLVKVKSSKIFPSSPSTSYSNTTLVKVKFIATAQKQALAKFKYNTC